MGIKVLLALLIGLFSFFLDRFLRFFWERPKIHMEFSPPDPAHYSVNGSQFFGHDEKHIFGWKAELTLYNKSGYDALGITVLDCRPVSLKQSVLNSLPEHLKKHERKSCEWKITKSLSVPQDAGPGEQGRIAARDCPQEWKEFVMTLAYSNVHGKLCYSRLQVKQGSPTLSYPFFNPNLWRRKGG
jgi:hypothetical protein